MQQCAWTFEGQHPNSILQLLVSNAAFGWVKTGLGHGVGFHFSGPSKGICFDVSWGKHGARPKMSTDPQTPSLSDRLPCLLLISLRKNAAVIDSLKNKPET